MANNFTIIKTLLLIGFLAITHLSLSAQQVVSIQGTLKNASGTAVADASYSVDFALYTSPSATTPVWTETAMVDVVGGIYSHNLGSETTLNGDDFQSTLYLGVTVNNFELLPRTMLTYAPYTLATAYASNSGTAAVVTCSGAVGDVKYSILNETQFAAVNGDCWVPLNGGDMTGSALAGILGNNTLPDMSGLFIRAQEYNDGNDPDRTPSSPIATLQDDELQSHTHDLTNNDWQATDINNVGYAGSNDFSMWRINDYGNNPETNTTTAVGGDETRPKNMNFYIYIRIN